MKNLLFFTLVVAASVTALLSIRADVVQAALQCHCLKPNGDCGLCNDDLSGTGSWRCSGSDPGNFCKAKNDSAYTCTKHPIDPDVPCGTKITYTLGGCQGTGTNTGQDCSATRGQDPADDCNGNGNDV